MKHRVIRLDELEEGDAVYVRLKLKVVVSVFPFYLGDVRQVAHFQVLLLGLRQKRLENYLAILRRFNLDSVFLVVLVHLLKPLVPLLELVLGRVIEDLFHDLFDSLLFSL